MAGTTRTILGPVAKQRKPTAPPPRAEAAPTMSPADAGREAVRQRWRQKPPEAKADTIRGLLVNPARRTVKEIRLPAEPGDAEQGYGAQIAMGEVEKLVGGDAIESLDLADNEIVLVDALRQGETTETWTFGGDGEPIVGVGVIISYDPEADEYTDSKLSLDQARKAVAFGDSEVEDNQQEQ